MMGLQEQIDVIQGLSAPMKPGVVEAKGLTGAEERLEGIRAVVFDVYGTLLISGTGDISLAEELSDAAAMTGALTEAGFLGDLAAAGEEGPDLLTGAIREAHEQARENGIEYPEVDIREIWVSVLSTLEDRGLLLDGWSVDQRDQLAVGYECRVNPVWPMPEFPEVAGELRDMGMRLGIVSNAQFYTPLLFQALAGAELETLGFEPKLMVWSWILRRGKPSVELYEALAVGLRMEHGIEPGETLFVGNDMLKDIWAAKQAGFRTALFAGDARSLRLREGDPRCRGLRPDIAIRELGELMGFVNGD